MSKVIEGIMQRHPDLTSFGLCTYTGDNVSKEEMENAYKEQRQRLLDNTDKFNQVCQWLKGVEKTKSINKKHNSYGLKHIAEKDIDDGYVENGVFIAAAIHTGFKFVQCPGTPNPNAFFNMSERSIKKILKRQNEQDHNWAI